MFNFPDNLVDKSVFFVFLRFERKDGSKHFFYSAVNKMSGNRLTGFDCAPPSVGDSLAYVRGVIKQIKTKEKVLEEVNT